MGFVSFAGQRTTSPQQPENYLSWTEKQARAVIKRMTARKLAFERIAQLVEEATAKKKKTRAKVRH